ncbi:MAG: helix-turn-helix transcriptional regulator [Bacteroidota bacterium]
MDPKDNKPIPYYAQKIIDLIEGTPGASNISLAEAIGRDRNTIRNYVTGTTSIKLDDLERIAEYFNLPVADFLDPSVITSSQNSQTSDTTIWKQLLKEKDERIKELKDQLEFLKKFYEQFSKGA